MIAPIQPTAFNNQWSAFVFHEYTRRQSGVEAIAAELAQEPDMARSRGQIEMQVLTSVCPAGNA